VTAHDSIEKEVPLLQTRKLLNEVCQVLESRGDSVSSLASWMGPAPSSLLDLMPERSPLDCLLKHWKDLDTNNLKKKTLTFLCTEARPKCPLGDQESWLPEGSIHYNTILQLDLFCRGRKNVPKFPMPRFSFPSETIQNDPTSSIWTPGSWSWSVAPSPLRKLRVKNPCKHPRAKMRGQMVLPK
jgi:hypothetical protein